MTHHEEDQYLYNLGRVVGYLGSILQLMDIPGARGLAFVLWVEWLAIAEEVDGDAKAAAATISEKLAALEELPNVPADVIAPLKEVCQKYKDEFATKAATLMVKRRCDDPTDPDMFNRGRIEILLKDLDVSIRARLALQEKGSNVETMDLSKKIIEEQFSALMQYGIAAKTLTEAQELYRKQFDRKQGASTDRIRQEIMNRRRFGAGLEADRAALIKEFPDQEAFINAEYRKEHMNLRKTV
jgi:hypothetical protein